MTYHQGQEPPFTLHPLDVVFIAADPEAGPRPATEHVALVAPGRLPPPTEAPPLPQPVVEADASQTVRDKEQLLGLWVYGSPENARHFQDGNTGHIESIQAGPRWRQKFAGWTSHGYPGYERLGDAEVVWNMAGRALPRVAAREALMEFHRRMGMTPPGHTPIELVYGGAFSITAFGGEAQAGETWKDRPPVQTVNCLGFVLSVLALGEFPAFDIQDHRWTEPRYPDPYGEARERDHPSCGHLAHALRDDAPGGLVTFGTLEKVSHYALAATTLRELQAEPTVATPGNGP